MESRLIKTKCSLFARNEIDVDNGSDIRSVSVDLMLEISSS